MSASERLEVLGASARDMRRPLQTVLHYIEMSHDASILKAYIGVVCNKLISGVNTKGYIENLVSVLVLHTFSRKFHQIICASHRLKSLIE